MKPTVGRIVHYVSFGTPGGEYASECRAAVVAGVPRPLNDAQEIDLVVLNPTGLFFNRCAYHEGDVGHDHAGQEIEARSYPGGTWHWPERVEFTADLDDRGRPIVVDEEDGSETRVP